MRVIAPQPPVEYTVVLTEAEVDEIIRGLDRIAGANCNQLYKEFHELRRGK